MEVFPVNHYPHNPEQVKQIVIRLDLHYIFGTVPKEGLELQRRM